MEPRGPELGGEAAADAPDPSRGCPLGRHAGPSHAATRRAQGVSDRSPLRNCHAWPPGQGGQALYGLGRGAGGGGHG
eukprot:5090101-Alexandrium_andersonii.AAC.1